jgi:hybrid cluster-associated redox disulfide protein
MKKKSQEQLITKDTLLMKAIEEYPSIAPILTGYGLHCVGCSFSNFDTVEAGAKIHGMPKEEFEMMLKDINAIASESN